MATTTLKIIGMHCASCAMLIEDAVGDIPGVRTCVVDPGAATATVEHEDSLDPALLVKEIVGLNGGYSAQTV